MIVNNFREVAIEIGFNVKNVVFCKVEVTIMVIKVFHNKKDEEKLPIKIHSNFNKKDNLN